MSKKTFKERLIAGLKASGAVEDPVGRSHYTELKRPGEQSKYFVGAYGALRKGKCASRSRSIGDPSNQTQAYLKYLALGDAELAKSEPHQPNADEYIYI